MLDSNLYLDKVKSKNIPPKANVAIAAAITSYARIHMMDLKLSTDTLYSDTDSIFTSHPVDSRLIGPELGQLKDELNGSTIDKALFLGIKQYGYQYKDKEGNLIEKSVWAGVTRDTLSFNTLEGIAQNKPHTVVADKRFFRDFSNLEIAIKDVSIKLVNKEEKLLIDNLYYPNYINNPLNRDKTP